MSKLTMKDCPRRKFTKKELETLEKCHYLHHKSFRGFDIDKDEQTLFIDMFIKCEKILY